MRTLAIAHKITIAAITIPAGGTAQRSRQAFALDVLANCERTSVRVPDDKRRGVNGNSVSAG